jgi:hypothetical protein
MKISGFHERMDGSPSSSLTSSYFWEPQFDISKPVLSTVSKSVGTY